MENNKKELLKKLCSSKTSTFEYTYADRYITRDGVVYKVPYEGITPGGCSSGLDPKYGAPIVIGNCDNLDTIDLV